VVGGGSLAGMLAARVLADHFDRVTLLERDRFPENPGARKGLPQGLHVHDLLERGRRALEGGRAINEGAIHPELLIPNVGLEPTPSCEDRILSPGRLPYSWYWKHVAVVLKVCESMASTSRPWCFRIVATWG
jgi:hypothetical protein